MAYINLPNDPVSGNLRDGEDYAKGSYVYANDKAIVDEVNGNLDNVNIKSNANIAVSKISGTAVNLTSEQVVENKHFINCTIGTNQFDFEKALVPIGTIVPIYDFGGALTFDSDYYAYCNGQSKTIGGVSRTLPDLSNRYIVGFGTEGGADIGSAAWAIGAVGAASHKVDLRHVHANTVGASDLSLGTTNKTSTDPTPDDTGSASTTYTGNEASHTHSTPNHRHNIEYSTVRVAASSGGAATPIYSADSDGAMIGASVTGPSIDTVRRHTNRTVSSGASTSGAGSTHKHTLAHTHNIDHTHSTNITHSHTHGSAQHSITNVNPTATGVVADWSAVSIQPRSIRCRYIMRIK